MKFKFLILFSLFCFGTNAVNSQHFDFKIDHTTLLVKDIAKMGDFYKGIMRLKEIPFPGDNPNRRWFQIHGSSQLHLIKEDFEDFKKDKKLHLCLSTPNIEAFIEHLKSNRIVYEDWKGKKNTIRVRPDGVRQIYIQDPEGYWIEINDAMH